MSHFDRKHFNKANNYVRDYYKTLGEEQYKIYVGNALMLKSKDFEKWIYSEFNELIKLTERQRLCLTGRYCNCNNCLECPFEKEGKI